MMTWWSQMVEQRGYIKKKNYYFTLILMINNYSAFTVLLSQCTLWITSKPGESEWENITKNFSYHAKAEFSNHFKLLYANKLETSTYSLPIRGIVVPKCQLGRLGTIPDQWGKKYAPEVHSPVGEGELRVMAQPSLVKSQELSFLKCHSLILKPILVKSVW